MASASDPPAHPALQPADQLILPPQPPPPAVETSIGPPHCPPEAPSQTRSFNRACAPARGTQTLIRLVLLPIPILSWILIATSPLSFAALIAIKGWSAMPIASAGLLFVLFVYLLVSFAGLLVLFAGLAVATKRLHDRGKSAWWLLLFYLVPAI